MTIYPALKVEIAFQNDPYAVSPTWTDVTRYVRGDVSTKRGRNYELNKNDAGTASVTLENTDGRFDPFNTASPYAPYVLPYRAIRITCVDKAGTVYPIFRGFIERWPQQWSSAGNYGTVQITAVDGLKTALLRTFGLRYYEQVLADGAKRYNRLNDKALGATLVGTDTFLSIGPDSFGTVNAIINDTNGNVKVVAPIVGADVALQWTFTAASSHPLGATPTANYIQSNTGSGYANANAAEVWWRPDSAIPTGGQVWCIMGSQQDITTGTPYTPVGTQLEAHFDSGGATYQYRYWNTNDFNANAGAFPLGAGVVTTIAGVVPTQGRADHIVVRVTGATYATCLHEIFINGALVASITQPINTANHYVPFHLAPWYVVPSGFQCTYDDWAVYGTLSNAQIAFHYLFKSYVGDFPAQVSGARINGVLDAIGWPASQRSVDAGQSTLQATGSLAGTQALASLQAAASDELGNVFIDGQGRIVFRQRSARNGAASVATFGEGSGEIPYLDGVTVDFDDTYVSNLVSVTQSGTSPVVVRNGADTASQATYGVRSLPITTAVSSTADVQGMTDTLLARYKQPVGRLSTIAVDVKATPSVIARCLARELGDAATVKRRPIGAPVITLPVFIDGIADVISPTTWTRTFLLTPKFADSTY